jgi:Domain of unknown function (DUF4177)
MQWEYQIVEGRLDAHVLNGFGKEGWELVNLCQSKGEGIGGSVLLQFSLVFKRPLKQVASSGMTTSTHRSSDPSTAWMG